MKINYKMLGIGLTGGVRVLLEIANKLIERGHEVTITYLRTENDHGWLLLKGKTTHVKRPKYIIGIGSRMQRLLKNDWLDSLLYQFFEIWKSPFICPVH